MGVEIERKFLVAGDGWRAAAVGAVEIRQGYLVSDRDRSVRVRLAGREGWLTVKGGRRGLTRAEFEYAVPEADARGMMELCTGPPVVKIRYRVAVGEHVWEVDEFRGANAPLVLAELELTAEDETFTRPPWLGREVSTDHRYANSHLAAHPWSTWPADGR